MVADEIIYASLGLSVATLVLLVVFFLRVGSLITKKVADIATKIEQNSAAIMAGVGDLAGRMQAPQPKMETGPETTPREEGISMPGGLGGQVGSGGRGAQPTATELPTGQALQPGKRYKYVMDPVTRKMKLVEAD